MPNFMTRAEAWHYRIFPNFSHYFRFKMAESTSKTLKYEQIKREMSRETLLNLPKEKLKTYCKDFGLNPVVPCPRAP